MGVPGTGQWGQRAGEGRSVEEGWWGSGTGAAAGQGLVLRCLQCLWAVAEEQQLLSEAAEAKQSLTPRLSFPSSRVAALAPALQRFHPCVCPPLSRWPLRAPRHARVCPRRGHPQQRWSGCSRLGCAGRWLGGDCGWGHSRVTSAAPGDAGEMGWHMGPGPPRTSHGSCSSQPSRLLPCF